MLLAALAGLDQFWHGRGTWAASWRDCLREEAAVVGAGGSGRIEWRMSRATGVGTCVEVAVTGRDVLVRDSKDRSGPVISFAPAAWRAFVNWIGSEDFGDNGDS